MNMISTGAFQTEMDASIKQETLTEKFARVWEKKNSKVARAGGVSLMALTLAACGSDDATTTDTTTETTTDTTTVTPPAAQSFSLTTGVDEMTGGAGDDSFTGINEATIAAGDTVSAADVLDGGAGADSLRIVNTQDALDAFESKSIETVILRMLDGDNTAATINMANMADVTSLTLDDMTDGATLNSMDLVTVVNITNNTMDNAADDITINHVATQVSGSTDVKTVNITKSVLQQLVVDDIETLNITNVSGTSSTTSLDADAATTINIVNTAGKLTVSAFGDNAATKIDIDGAGETILSAAPTTLKTIDASGSSGKVTATTVAATTAVTGGSAVDSITVAAAPSTVLNVNAGAGDDVITANALTLTGAVIDNLATGVIIDGGDGTDTLVASELDATAAAFVTNVKNAQNFEVLRFSDNVAGAEETIDLDPTKDFGGINVFEFATAITHAADANNARDAAVAIVNDTGAATYKFKANITGEAGTAGADEDGTDAVTVGVQTDTGANTLNIEMTGSTTITGGLAIDNGNNDGETGGDGIDASNVDIVNIVSSAATATTTANVLAGGSGAGGTDGVGLRAAANSTVNISGAEDFTATFGGTNITINGASATGKLSLTGEAGNNTITGGSAVDTITGGAGSDVLTGGAGADIFVFATATDSEALAGGVGADVIKDYAAGDIVRVDAGNNVAGKSATAGTTATSNVDVATGGKVTFAAADDTLTEMLVAVAADDTDIAANETVFFEVGGNTYIYGAGTNTTTATADFLIVLEGVTGMTTLSENATTAGDFTIA